MTPIRDIDTFDQPAQRPDSRVVVERKEGGLTALRVPPDPFFASPAAIILSIALGLTLFGTVFARQSLPGPLRLLVSPLVLAGVGIPLAWHICKRWTVLAVSAEGLGVLRTGGPFKPWEEYWASSQITAIRTGPGSVGRRGKDICELYVYLADGKKIGLGCGRAHDELRWLATVLRQTLQVPAVARETMAE
jgi:hypothetical protein